MVGRFLLGMISGGLLVTGGLVVGSVVFPPPPANDNRSAAKLEAQVEAHDATQADAGPKVEVRAEPEPAETEMAKATESAPKAAAAAPDSPSETLAPVEPATETAIAEPVTEPATDPEPKPTAPADSTPAESTPVVETDPKPLPAVEPEPEVQPEVADAVGGPESSGGEDAPEPETPAIAEVTKPDLPSNPRRLPMVKADVAAEASAAPTPEASPAPEESDVALADTGTETAQPAQPTDATVEPAADPETEVAQAEVEAAEAAAPEELPVEPVAEPEPPAAASVAVEPEAEAGDGDDPMMEAPAVVELAPVEEAPAEATETAPVAEVPSEAPQVDELPVPEAPAVAEAAEATEEVLVEAAPEPEVPLVTEIPAEAAHSTELPQGAEVPAEDTLVEEALVEETPAELAPPVEEALPEPEVTELPEALPEPLPDPLTEAEGEAVAELPAEEEEKGSTFKPVTSLIERGEGAITDRGADGEAEAAEAPVADDPVAPADARPIVQHASKFENPDDKPVLAVVLIDYGSPDLDRAGLAALPFPVSFALDPLDPATPERAATYRGAGKEVVMLVTGIAEGAQASDVEVAFQSMEQGLPEAVAVMDLVEPAFQNNRLLASAVVPIVKSQGRGLLTWDAGLNAADQVARREDLEAAVVFRDLGSAGGDPVAVRRLLDRAVFKAGQEGRVSVVGQADAATVAALLEWTVEGKAATVALAPLTAVMKVD